MSILRVFCFFILVWGTSSGTECKQNQFFEDAGPLVKTTAGAVVGKYIQYYDTKVAAFFGIPFAKPPVGQHRFTKPEPAEPWDGILFTQKDSPQCIQNLDPSLDIFSDAPANMNEDCLYLNLWAPSSCCCNKFEKKPVLVWIYGGGFSAGSADSNIFDGSKLAAFGGAVVVAMNYRVGPLGFLNVGNEEAPGNVGLHDQVLAFKWVKENIERFGGDPESITLFGESAGSLSIGLHLISPISRNLFHRGIMQSGAMYNSFYVDSAEKAQNGANALAVAVGCANDSANLKTHPSEVIQCLKLKDPMILSRKDFELKSKSFTYISVGNEFLPKHPIEAYDSGDFAHIDIMIGATRDEGTMFLPFMAESMFSFQAEPKLNLSDVEKAMPILFSRWFSAEEQRKIYDHYFKDVNEDDSPALLNALQLALGDFYMNCPMMFFSEKLKSAYMYWMTHESSTDSIFPSWLGVYHSVDVDYVFGKPLLTGKPFLPRDEKFSNDIIRMWVNFARNGHPTNEENKVQWPKFSLSENTTYELNEGHYKTIPYPRQESCNFWRPFLVSTS